jgi:uncharacterized membrane protein YjgN (DUF898 family)
MSDSFEINVSPSVESRDQGPLEQKATPELPYRAFEFAYRGDGLELGLIMLKNAMLAIVTLGIYQFWGRTRTRRYIWSQSEFDGHRLNFTGTGEELFIGALKLFGCYIVYAILGALIQKLGGQTLFFIWSLASSAIFSAAFAILILFSARYRLSRTIYRGVRFNVCTNDLKPVFLLSLKGAFFTLLTLGLYFPIYMNKLHGEIINRSSFGSLKFKYSGRDLEAFQIWIKALIFTPLTLGIYLPFYRAELLRFRARHTRFGDDLVLQDTIAGWDLLKVMLLSLIFIPLSLGLATPWIISYVYRLRLSRLKAWGKLDFAEVMQDTQASPSRGTFGESVVDSFDLSLDIG